MRKFIAFVCLFAAIALTTTGIARDRVDTGPPVIETLHSPVIDLQYVDLEAVVPFDVAATPGSGSSQSSIVLPARVKEPAEAAQYLVLDRYRRSYNDHILTYDFNYWREQIKPLLQTERATGRSFAARE